MSFPPAFDSDSKKSTTMSFLGGSPYSRKMSSQKKSASDLVDSDPPNKQILKEKSEVALPIAEVISSEEEVVINVSKGENSRKNALEDETSSDELGPPIKDAFKRKSSSTKAVSANPAPVKKVYPPFTSTVREQLLRCHDDMNAYIEDLCDENAKLHDLYEEIRLSPLAAAIKEEYENHIKELEDKCRSLDDECNDYKNENDALRRELEDERNANASFQLRLRDMERLQQDLNATMVQKEIVVKELGACQHDVDSLKREKRDLEGTIDDQKKEIRSLNIQLSALRENTDTRPTPYERERERSEIKRSAPEEYGGELVRQVRPLPPRPAKYIASGVSIRDYEGSREIDALPFKKGTRMNIIRYSSNREWVYVMFNGSTTWAPVCFLSLSGYENENYRYNRPASIHDNDLSAAVSSTKKGKVLNDFNGVDSTEASVKKGEIVSILREAGEWILIEIGIRKGWVPTTFITII